MSYFQLVEHLTCTQVFFMKSLIFFYKKENDQDLEVKEQDSIPFGVMILGQSLKNHPVDVSTMIKN